ncbi:hypothetical protein [Kordiimonas gwangyangensis]|uniref:hypothetical protein n=1 Tax=Kordiimonas gwangyangensis TaxID=288022 RepID=UPI00036568BD|nr:hypothetical protein [Kordiimonas gwangyangensis]
MFECLSCELLNELYLTSTTLTAKIFMKIAPVAALIFGTFLTIYFLAQLSLGMMENTLMDRLKKLPIVLFWSAVVIVLFTVQPNAKPIIFSWLIEPVEQGALAVGLELLDIAEIPVNAPAKLTTVEILGQEIVNRYAQLGYAVEKSVYYVMGLAWNLISNSPVGAISGVLLLIPFGLLLIYFSFLLVTASFSFLAAGAALPLALIGIPFPKFRGIWMGCWSLFRLGFFTTFFICLAMSFSITAIDGLSRKISTIQALTEYFQPRINEQNALMLKHCPAVLLEGSNHAIRRTENPDYDPSKCSQAQKTYADLTVEFDQASPLAPGNSAYFILLIMGGVALLLHYQASKFAANFSGAQDAGGAALAFAAGTKALAIGAIAAANPKGLASLVNQPASSLKDAFRGSGGGETFGRKSPLDLSKE